MHGVDSVYCENKQEWLEEGVQRGIRLNKMYVECRISHTTPNVEGSPMKAIKTVQGEVGVQVFDHAAGVYIFTPNTTFGGKMKAVTLNFKDEDKVWCQVTNHSDRRDHYTIDCSKGV